MTETDTIEEVTSRPFKDEIHEGLYVDDSDKTFTFFKVQDVEPILEKNKELRSQEQKSDWMRHFASTPVILLEKWLNEEWARGNVHIRWGSPEYDALMWRKLNDPEYAYLRTDHKGHHSGYNVPILGAS